MSPGVNQAAVEGALVFLAPASFTDGGVLDTHDASIDWGDGTNPDGGVIDVASGTVSGFHAYADGGAYTVTVEVCDDEQDCGTGVFQVTVGNVDPTVDAGTTQSVVEGQLMALDPAIFSDPGYDCRQCDPPTAEDFTAAIDWGDGTTEPAMNITLVEEPGEELAPTTGTVQASHAYADDGAYTVTVTVCDDQNGCDSDTLIVNVANVAPAVNAGTARSEFEGVFVTLDPASFSDPGFDHAPGSTSEDFTASIDWGDGTTEPPGDIAVVETPGAEGEPTTGTVQASHAYADDGAYTVTVRVCDDDGSCGVDTTIVEIGNVAPTLDAGSNQTVDEGDTVTLDPATYDDLGFDNELGPTSEDFTASIDWGDGTLDSGGDVVVTEATGAEGIETTGTIQGSHVYADDGLYRVEVEVCDDDGGCASGLLFVTVNSVAPAVEAGGNQVADEGTFISLDPAFFSDPGFDCPTCAPPSAEDFTVSIDWGDGTTEPAGNVTLIETSGAEGQETSGTVQGSHAYGDNGEYTVTVEVCDDNGDCGSDSFAVTVGNVAPTVLDVGEDQETFEGIFVSLPPVSFSDPGFDNPEAPSVEPFTATIDWGDNTSEPAADMVFAVAQGGEGTVTSGTLNASHSYPDVGVYTVEIEVCDDDGGCDGGSFQVTVINVPPTVDAGEDQTVEEGFLLTLDPVTFTDVGFDNPLTGTLEDFTATIDWGDGTTEPPGDITLVEAPGDENNLTTGTVQAAHAYGDNGTFVITVCVDDDDGGHTCGTLVATVNNVDPSLTLDTGDATTFTSGETAYIGRKGVEQSHDASATDPGSDDLEFDWTFLPDPYLELEIYHNNGIDPDPAQSPHGVYPFGASDTADVTFTAPGIYTVAVEVTDDDGGADADSLWKLVTDDCDCTKSQGFWKHEYSDKGKNQIDDETLGIYLAIVRFASGIFDEDIALTTLQDANVVLNPEKNRGNGPTGSGHGGQTQGTLPSNERKKDKKDDNGSNGGSGGGDDDSDAGSTAKKREKALTQTLAAWLNFAKGAIDWNELVDTDEDGVPDTAFGDLIGEVESILANTEATAEDLERAKDLAEAVNEHDKDNPECDTGTGTGTKDATDDDDGTEKGTGKGDKDGDDNKKDKKKKGKGKGKK